MLIYEQQKGGKIHEKNKNISKKVMKKNENISFSESRGKNFSWEIVVAFLIKRWSGNFNKNNKLKQNIRNEIKIKFKMLNIIVFP